MSGSEANSVETTSVIQGDFGFALSWLKAGGRVRLEGWRATDEFIFLVAGSRFMVNRKPLLGIYAEGTEITYCSHLDKRQADGSVTPWAPSYAEMLAEDWEVVPEGSQPS